MKRKAGDVLAEYRGQDKIPGRPIRLNVAELHPRSGKKYAELLFWGDVHSGHPQSLIKEAKAALDFARKWKIYVILMGDLIEAGLRDSIGDSCYQQRLNPQEQMEEMIEMLEPIVKDGLVVGLHQGNHENRVTKNTSIDISKIMAKELGIPYLNYACWSLLKVGSQHYSMYSQHGKSGSRFKHTKLKAAIDQLAWIHADILAMGHVHSMAVEPTISQTLRYGRVVEANSHVILTGSYLSWDRSYAQAAALPMAQIGSPRVRLYADHKEIAGVI